MQLDKMILGRMAKELGFVRDTLEKVCRLADVLKFIEEDKFICFKSQIQNVSCVGFLCI